MARKAYYKGGYRVMMGGVPCRVSRLPECEGGKALMRESSREMCLPLPPRSRKGKAQWDKQQAEAYRAAEKLGNRNIGDVVTLTPAPLSVPVEAPQPVPQPRQIVAQTILRPAMKLAALNHPRVPSIVGPELAEAPLPAMARTMTTWGYCRVSTTSQAEDGESLGVQERQIQGWAMMKGETVAEIIVERGVSGSVPVSKRPEGARLWKMARKGDTIVCARLDRLFRSALDALQSVEEMQRRGVAIHVIDGLGEITGNGMAKAFLTISAAFAELERDTIRERISTVKADQRERGRYLGGKIPYGFRVESGLLVEIENKRAVIAAACAMRADGKPLRAIQSALETEHGERLSLDTIARVTNVADTR